MDAGLVAALAADRRAGLAALEVDEMHVPHVSDAVEPSVIVLLNLSRDQLDRVGEINVIERTLRAGLARHPKAVVVANCDDVLMTSAAYDSPNVVWVAAGGGVGERLGQLSAQRRGHRPRRGATGTPPAPTSNDPARSGGSTTTPCTGPTAWPCRCGWRCRARSTGATPPRPWPPPSRWALTRPRPSRRYRGSTRSPDATGPSASASTRRGSCWPRTRPAGRRRCRWWTSTRPGWSSRSTGRCPTARTCRGCGTCASSTSRRPPTVVAAGERGTDLAVRLGYAGVEHTLVHDTVAAIASCPPGRVEVVANYTAFLQLQRSVGAPWLTRQVRIGLVLPDVMGTYGDGGNAVVLRQRLRLAGHRRRDRRDHAGRSGAGVVGPVHAGRRGGLRAAAGHPAPAAVPRAAARGRPRRARAGDLRGRSRCSGTGTRRRRGNGSTASALLDATTSPQDARTIGELVSKPLLAGLDPTAHRLREPPRRHRPWTGGVAVGRGGQGRGQPVR